MSASPDCCLFPVKVPFGGEGETVLLLFSCAKVNAGVISRLCSFNSPLSHSNLSVVHVYK
jgi:hypothetical protein